MKKKKLKNMKKLVKKNLESEDRFQIASIFISLLEDSKKVNFDYVIGKTYIISNNENKVGFIYENSKLKLIKDKKVIYNLLEIINKNFDKFLVVSEGLLNFTYNDYDIFVSKIFQSKTFYLNDDNWFVIFEKER